MRGALSIRTPFVDIDGIIPAYAGSTERRRSRCTFNRDHPRVCGEHPTEHVFVREAMGSSPRMRGALCLRRQNHQVAGIIPAYAGSTSSAFVDKLFDWDHPRVCGEHEFRKIAQDTPAGSSPRMRGAPLINGAAPISIGIIPAYAGSTQRTRRSALFVLGSSPRMRGAPVPHLQEAEAPGIIPAYAGSTVPILSKTV